MMACLNNVSPSSMGDLDLDSIQNIFFLWGDLFELKCLYNAPVGIPL